MARPLLIFTCESRRVRSCARACVVHLTGRRERILGKIAVATDRSLACYWGDLTDRETKPSNVSFYARWSNVLIILAPQIRRDCEALLWAYSALLFVLLCSAVSSYKYTHTLCLRFASGGDFGSTVMLKSTQKSLSGVL